MLYRYASDEGYDVTARKSLTAFPDADGVAEYAKDAMEWACAEGILGGYDDGTLRPTATATRAVVATMMRNFISNVD